MSTSIGFDNVCKKCHTKYVYYGVPIKWTYINGDGPFCEKCIDKGIDVSYTMIGVDDTIDDSDDCCVVETLSEVVEGVGEIIGSIME